MPILIPSKNIYQVENPKVRDNVIERIEVSAVEVVPANKYEEPVFSERLNLNSSPSFETESSESSNAYPITGKAIAYSSCSIIYDKYITVDVTINRNTNNSYVKNIFLGKDKSENPYIKVNKAYEESSYFYKVPSSYVLNNDPNSQSYDLGNFVQNTIISYAGTKQKISSKTIYGIKPIRAVLTCNSSSDTNGFIDGFTTPAYVENPESNDLESFTTINRNGIEFTTTTKENFAIIETDLGGSIQIEETDTYYKIKGLKFFAGRTTYSCGTALQVTPSYSKPSYFPSQVLEVNQNVVQLEMTIYGNTIGIDLQDKTVYINGQTAKKVQSIDGNELMQTSNYTNNPTLNKLVEGKDYSVEYFDDLDGRYPSEEGNYGVRADIWVLNDELLGSDFVARLYNPDSDTIYYDTEFKNQQYNKMVVDDGGYYIGKAELFLKDSNAISVSYKKTQEKYKNGKETATIRCSISDYYEFNKPTLARYCKISDNGLVDISNNIRATISFGSVTKLNVYFVDETPYDTFVSWLVKLKNTDGTITEKSGIIYAGSISATGIRIASSVESIVSALAYFRKNMVFSTHDKVVPMVYGADGQDKPLSVYKDGTPKVFNVLGVEFLYDGAVWQILNLQEE